MPANPEGEIACGRDPLVDAITTFLAHRHVSQMSGIRAALERVVDEVGPEALDSLGRRLALAGTEWSCYTRDPLARRIHHVLAGPVLRETPLVSGEGFLDIVADQPVVILANHLSYSDANVVEVLLEMAGGRALSDRLTVLAGPKVYSNLRRRFSSLCFGTIKTPQSSARSSDEAVMNRREVARAARRAIEIADGRLLAGEALLVLHTNTAVFTVAIRLMTRTLAD
jgi:hypothetical protein